MPPLSGLCVVALNRKQQTVVLVIAACLRPRLGDCLFGPQSGLLFDSVVPLDVLVCLQFLVCGLDIPLSPSHILRIPPSIFPAYLPGCQASTIGINRNSSSPTPRILQSPLTYRAEDTSIKPPDLTSHGAFVGVGDLARSPALTQHSSN